MPTSHSEIAPENAGTSVKSQRAYKPKVKTGCLTCRKRKVKCDEAKPSCLKCSSTGRRCDGYNSNFVNAKPSEHVTAVRAATAAHPSTATSAYPTSSHGLRELARQFQFIHKPVVGLKYAYEVEATGILISSKADPSIRYALMSMSALREKYAKYGDYYTIKTHHAHELRPVFESYNAAIGSLTRRLSHGGHDAAGAALQCCQLFFSVEIMQHNYAAAIQHLAQGLRIMRDWRIRTYLNEKGDIMPPENPDLPQVDMFALKVFFAPCPGSRRMAKHSQMNGRPRTSHERTLVAMIEDPDRTEHIRTGRMKLLDIANTTFDFLADTGRSDPAALELGDRKRDLLHQLEVWDSLAKHLRQKDGTVWPVRIDEVAMFLFHQVLRLIVTSCVHSSKNTDLVENETSEVMRTAELLTNIRAEDLKLE
ncbi:putative Zn(2)-C6 fungal-type domain-containing protein [Seiridium unicorne]|uniref:Zn(2)-C6 fungal-type domain-containing protein n=1 Tax=Seiridium unicorne TaxID=138068 RepID=A0ABR2VE23_9PEZI